MKAIAPGAFAAALLTSAASAALSARRRSAPPQSPTWTRLAWSATSIMDAAGGSGDRAMSCAIGCVVGRGYNYYAGRGYFDHGYGYYGGPRFSIRGW